MPRFVLRSGSTLIVVAGLVSLQLALALAFLQRMRSDDEESARALREAQSRVMLVAACSYVLESGRIGWDTWFDDPAAPGSPRARSAWKGPPRMPARPLSPANPPMPATQRRLYHEEAFGWIDVRDGSVGPRTQDWDQDGEYDRRWDARPVEDSDGDGAPDRPAWPAIGSVARCPMEPMERPPCAIAATVAPNPIQATDPAAADFGLPLFREPDPKPAAATWQEFLAGDPRPRRGDHGRGWFRVFRDGPAQFVVTCGAGATRGFRDWNEVRGAHAEDVFGDAASFATYEAEDARLWYRIEWSAAIGGADYHLFDTDYFTNHWGGVLLRFDTGPFWHNDHYLQWPRNILSALYMHTGRGKTAATAPVNALGTIRWIQRLPTPPSRW